MPRSTACLASLTAAVIVILGSAFFAFAGASAPPAPFLPTVKPAKPAAIGKGRYHYQLTLREGGTLPMGDTPFALFLSNRPLPFVSAKNQVWQGTTDDFGRTPVFALPFRLRADEVVLRERIGSGPFGAVFAATADGEPFSVSPYSLVICTDPPRHVLGWTDARGYTAYVAADAPLDIYLYGEHMDGMAEAMAVDATRRASDDAAICKGDFERENFMGAARLQP